MAGELPPPPPHAQRSKITTDQIPSRTICDKANMLCYPAPTESELLRATIARSPKQSTEGFRIPLLPPDENGKNVKRLAAGWKNVSLASVLWVSIPRVMATQRWIVAGTEGAMARAIIGATEIEYRI